MIITIIATILAVAGTTNWLLVGLFNFNLVAWIFGATSIVSNIVYVLVGIAGFWLLSVLIATGGKTTEVVTTRKVTK